MFDPGLVISGIQTKGEFLLNHSQQFAKSPASSQLVSENNTCKNSRKFIDKPKSQKFAQSKDASPSQQQSDWPKKSELSIQNDVSVEILQQPDEVEQPQNLFILQEIQDNQKKKPSPTKYAYNIDHKNLDFLFDAQTMPTGEDGKLYIEDGDPNMYTPQAIEQRKQLKENIHVKEAVKKFMDIFIFDRYEKLNKLNYFQGFTLISHVLRKDLCEDDEDIDSLKQLLNEEWKRDSQGQSTISKEKLFDSLFELADIWTPDISEQQYCSFFEILRMKCQFQKFDINIYDLLE